MEQQGQQEPTGRQEPMEQQGQQEQQERQGPTEQQGRQELTEQQGQQERPALPVWQVQEQLFRLRRVSRFL